MELVLNQSSDVPLYMQLYNQISLQILNGTLQSGMQLPPIRSIATDFKISVIPVKMAWEALDKNGFIQTITGKGTFVAPISKTEIKQKQKQNIDDFVKEILQKAKEKNIGINEIVERLQKI